MKKLYLIGNMKMNMTKASLDPYFTELVKVAENTENVVGVCVPYVYLCKAQKMLEGSRVLYGAQNINEHASGAYTGEISASMLHEFGCNLVIIGHSERRQMYNETDVSVNEKVKVALSSGFTPVLCFGETLDERNANKHFDLVKKQIELATDGLTAEDVKNVIFAYEPIWAIGTGMTATSDQAEEIISYAKDLIVAKFGVKKNEIVMLYGGSLKPSNAEDLLSKPSIDGGLIGGACLKMEDFESIIYQNVE